MPKLVTVALKDASEDQLRAFATKNLGLQIHRMEKAKSILAKIQAAWDKPEITLTVDEAEAVERAPERAPADSKLGEEPWVEVNINITAEPGGKDAVWLSVNGRGQWIERGKSQAIRYRYFEVLRHGVRTDVDQVQDGIHLQNVETNAVAYPHNVLKMPSQEAIDAWLKADAEASDAASIAKLTKKAA